MLTQRESAGYLKMHPCTFIALRQTDSAFPPYIKRGRGMWFKQSDLDYYRDNHLNRKKNDPTKYSQGCRALLVSQLTPPPAVAVLPIRDGWRSYREVLEGVFSS